MPATKYLARGLRLFRADSNHPFYGARSCLRSSQIAAGAAAAMTFVKLFHPSPSRAHLIGMDVEKIFHPFNIDSKERVENDGEEQEGVI